MKNLFYLCLCILILVMTYGVFIDIRTANIESQIDLIETIEMEQEILELELQIKKLDSLKNATRN